MSKYLEEKVGVIYSNESVKESELFRLIVSTSCAVICLLLAKYGLGREI